MISVEETNLIGVSAISCWEVAKLVGRSVDENILKYPHVTTIH